MNDYKVLLRPERLREVPQRFSWCDQRLFRSGVTAACGSDALALYLFLLSVADSRGLSYYSDTGISRLVRLDPVSLAAARAQLVAADLIAYQRPHAQVLSLPERHSTPPTQRLGEAASVGDILRRVLGAGGAP